MTDDQIMLALLAFLVIIGARQAGILWGFEAKVAYLIGSAFGAALGFVLAQVL